MSIKVLRANGTVTRNGWTGPIVGSNPIGDNDSATYIEQDFSAGSTLGVTVGLEPLVGYQPGDPISVAVQMDVTLVPDDPTTEGVLELFIATTPEGAEPDEVAGFSDGAHSGFGFRFTVSGLWTAPLRLAPQWDTPLDDLVAALEVGAYLDINAISWQDGEVQPIYRLTYAEVRVGTANRHAPPLRQFPRSDGLGSGPKRIYPPPDTRRRFGGIV